MINRLLGSQNAPVIIGLVRSILTLVILLGLPITTEQAAVIITIVQLTLSLVTNSVTQPRQDDPPNELHNPQTLVRVSTRD